ncbi:polyphosphate kinase 2 [Aestuariicella sp. G3-2]|uniref:polyphosphate kinase 2 n=1 Tax=Pseudomaricurvus albidus TaxID=2842452 RepID=UPI001C0CCAC1|nr:polyphosphate kinase 2 [Aestuariicella albida]MBU3068420.1 polyphosphate kinase 2 [Aestuariicella albida]
MNTDHPDLIHYKKLMHDLQIKLVHLQSHIIRNELQLLIIFEGRDSAGKDGAIKRITEHLSPRDIRVVALNKPTERDKNSWYFQRYTDYLPSRGEMVLFNRSWYNRAGVEPVMGFCTEHEYQRFLHTVPTFEQMLMESGIQIVKYYLDISKPEQHKRLEDRRTNPLKQWKISPIDQLAQDQWDDYSKARDEMLSRTHTDKTPWYIVNANNKKRARLNIIRHLLQVIHVDQTQENNGHTLQQVDSSIVFPFSESHLTDGTLYS